jgi:hypothetical protein
VYYREQLDQEWERYHERVEYIDAYAAAFGFEVVNPEE